MALYNQATDDTTDDDTSPAAKKAKIGPPGNNLSVAPAPAQAPPPQNLPTGVAAGQAVGKFFSDGSPQYQAAQQAKSAASLDTVTSPFRQAGNAVGNFFSGLSGGTGSQFNPSPYSDALLKKANAQLNLPPVDGTANIPGIKTASATPTVQGNPSQVSNNVPNAGYDATKPLFTPNFPGAQTQGGITPLKANPDGTSISPPTPVGATSFSGRPLGQNINGVPTFSDGSGASGIPRTISDDQIADLSKRINTISDTNLANPAPGVASSLASGGQYTPAVNASPGVSALNGRPQTSVEDAQANAASDLASVLSEDPRSVLGRAARTARLNLNNPNVNRGFINSRNQSGELPYQQVLGSTLAGINSNTQDALRQNLTEQEGINQQANTNLAQAGETGRTQLTQGAETQRLNMQQNAPTAEVTPTGAYRLRTGNVITPIKDENGNLAEAPLGASLTEGGRALQNYLGQIGQAVAAGTMTPEQGAEAGRLMSISLIHNSRVQGGKQVAAGVPPGAKEGDEFTDKNGTKMVIKNGQAVPG